MGRSFSGSTVGYGVNEAQGIAAQAISREDRNAMDY
jgi:hypothetical protein